MNHIDEQLTSLMERIEILEDSAVKCSILFTVIAKKLGLSGSDIVTLAQAELDGVLDVIGELKSKEPLQ
jgi:hypothetical protein